MADQFRAEAVVVDKFTEPLRRLQERLNSVRSPEHLKELGEHFDKAKERVERLTEAMKGGLEPAMAGVGISGLALGGTFAGIIQATRSFAESTASLSRLSKETGLSIERIREMDSVFGKLGVKAEAVNGSMVTFRQNLHDIQRNRGDAFGWLTAQQPQLARQLHDAKTPDEALGRAYGFLQRIPDPTERAEASTRLFGTPEIGRIQEMSKSEVADAIRDADKAQGQISESAKKAAEDFETLTGRLRDALTGLRDDVGAKVLPYLNGLVAGSASFIENHHAATLASGAVASGGATVVATHLGRRLFRNMLGRASHAAAEAPVESAAARVAEKSTASGAAVAAEEGGSIFSRLAPALSVGARILGPVSAVLALRDLGESMNPTTPAGAPYRLDQLPGWAAKTEQARRSADEFKRDPEAARGRAMMERDLTEIQTNATKDGTVEGLKRATPDAEKTVKGWFDWIWKSALNGGDSSGGSMFGGGGARLWNASYEVGGGTGSGFRGGGSGGDMAPTYRGTNDSASVKEHIGFIRSAAAALGIDPDQAVRVANSEGLHKFTGDRGTSFGDFQLHIKNRIPGLSLGGLGDVFRKETGLDPSDPHNWRKMDVFALQKAREQGWTPWHGWRGAKWSGIGAMPRGVPLPDTAPHNDEPGYAGGGQRGPAADISGRAYPHDWKRVLDSNRVLTQGTGMGFLGGAQVNPEGNVTVNLHGFPSGTKANTSADGFFKGVKVNRGRAMSVASEDI